MRYKRTIIEVGKDISEKVDKRLITNNIETCSENYKYPVIPEGYTHICGEWYNGFVIQNNYDGSQFVWIPVGSLDADGTLDGENFTEKFGRRIYQLHKFSTIILYEKLERRLALQFESVKKYGGFWFSRFNISQNIKSGKPQSVKGAKPWSNINFYDAMKAATMLSRYQEISSHLPFGAEYDSVLAWFIKSKAKKIEEIIEDSTHWGNHWNTKNSPKKVAKTGSNEDWCVNNIYDLSGNLDEWTQEQGGNLYRIIRGGDILSNGNDCTVSYRYPCNPYTRSITTGFRASLYIK